jgi:hypothetical protein
MNETSPTPAQVQAPSSPKGLLARYWWVVGVAIAGGLDSLAIDQGFEGVGTDSGIQVLRDYSIPGLDGTVSTIIAGLVGVAIVFGLVFLLGRVLARRRKDTAA